jgi:pimeloyl-ACP methyl ester carboxylesterase
VNTPRHPAAWIAVVAGLVWLIILGDRGLIAFLLAVVPGTLLVTGGFGTYILPGDVRLQSVAAIGGILGVALSLPFLAFGVWMALWAGLLSAASFVAAGWIALALEPDYDEVPTYPLTLRYAARAAADEALIFVMFNAGRRPDRNEQRGAAAELIEAHALFDSRGWLDDPVTFHQTAPPPESVEVRPRKERGIAHEHLRFDSGYAPDPAVPGTQRWLGFEANRTAHAWVLRHVGEPRPWIVCIHGFGMGTGAFDLRAFEVEWLHRDLRLNVALPVLPMHGPRAPGRRSGAEFFGTSLLNSVHAEAQSMWDLRRLLAWIRAQGETRVGVYGLSLGGYTTALFAALEADLACAIAGIPAADFLRGATRVMTGLDALWMQRLGVDLDMARRVLRPISPLALKPKVPKERRYILAATGDRLVTPDQVRDLWVHWDRPRIAWGAASHLTALRAPEPRALLREALQTTLVEPEMKEASAARA